MQGEGYRDMLDIAGAQRACRAFGLFCKMLEIAANKCREYRGIYDGGTIKIWCSEAIPLYPVKIAIHRYDKVVELLAYGEDGVSEFLSSPNNRKKM